MIPRNAFDSKLVIPALLVGLLVVALLSPVSIDGRYGDPRLSTYVTGPLGARGLLETVSRLGWRPERQITPGFATIDSTTIIGLLAPPVTLSERETGILLDRVRAGSSLLMVVEDGTPLADSLGLATAGGMTVAPVADTSTAACPAGETRSSLRFLRGKLYVTPFTPRRKLPNDRRLFLSAESPASRRLRIPVAIGFPFGSGRIAAVSDPNVFRNDVIRVCRWNAGFTVVRMVEYLSGGAPIPKRRMVFDEFHQGFGQQPDVGRAVVRTLTHTPPGRTIAQIALAAIVLLAAVAPRPIAPRPSTRVERRSPFEHVDALASAYDQAGATQLATQRLVRGLKRRIAGPGAASLTSTVHDTDFLESISRSHPELSDDVAALQHALERSVTSDELVIAGRAIQHIERTLIA